MRTCVAVAFGALIAVTGWGGRAQAQTVEAFLAGRLPFTGIAQVIGHALDAVPAAEAASLEAVIAADGESRRTAGKRVAALAPALS